MLWFRKKSSLKERLAGLKSIKVHGMEFTIRRVNPFIDFAGDDLPAMFTDFQSRRKGTDPVTTKESLAKIKEMMFRYISAGLVYPELVPVGKGDDRGKENGVTVEDIFRDPTIGAKLFNEIVYHSSGETRGLKKLFFSIRKRLGLLTLYADGTVNDLATMSSKEGD